MGSLHILTSTRHLILADFNFHLAQVKYLPQGWQLVLHPGSAKLDHVPLFLILSTSYNPSINCTAFPLLSASTIGHTHLILANMMSYNSSALIYTRKKEEAYLLAFPLTNPHLIGMGTKFSKSTDGFQAHLVWNNPST